ncbi:11934_t:CDS:2 [Funneliformis mosseae]|uniref:11934_t:CDS:1 n=1 Tax=Funneliformis mosseae TaxID=27381 RepID=A0A9N9EGT2_FUNMO|nr:11934_t:CDS:2 [Funneliformis mosseae]
MFLKAKEANRWPDNRRVAIATEMLRKEAADWYNLKLANRVDARGILNAFKMSLLLKLNC